MGYFVNFLYTSPKSRHKRSPGSKNILNDDAINDFTYDRSSAAPGKAAGPKFEKLEAPEINAFRLKMFLKCGARFERENVAKS